MSFRVACVFAVLIACLGCGESTLYIGTAHSSDSDAEATAQPEANTATTPPQPPAATVDAPPRAGTGGTPELQPSAAGQPGSSTTGTPPVQADEDAGAADAPASPKPSELKPQRLPSPDGQCPQLGGEGTYMFSAKGRSLLAHLFMRADAKSQPAPGGPLILYLHSAGRDWSEAVTGLGQAAIDRVVAQGGVVVAANAAPCLRCGLADDVVWYDEDNAVFDQVIACALQAAQIDTRRIHALGFSAGALRAMHLALARSNYIASVVSYSGGIPISQPELQDPANKVPALLSFGAQGVDNALVDFNLASRAWYDTYSPRGYYALLCNHGRGHELPPELAPHAIRFLLDHPYRVEPEPYKDAIPPELPTYCANAP